jgi:adenylate kinase family enzyme
LKICIIGNGGSGKSTLAYVLGRHLNIPVVHLDKLTWKENFERHPIEEFTARLENELRKDKWIIEGWAYHETLYERLQQSNVIIFLHYPLRFCMESAIKRNREYNNKSYPFDPFTGDRGTMEPLLVQAINFVHDKCIPEVLQWLEDLKKTRQVFIYYSREELNDNMEGLLTTLKNFN